MSGKKKYSNALRLYIVQEYLESENGRLEMQMLSVFVLGVFVIGHARSGLIYNSFGCRDIPLCLRLSRSIMFVE